MRKSIFGALLFFLLASTTSAQLVISEFRMRGPNGANDEFIEIYNNTGANHTVTATGAGTGYGVAASDGVLRCSIPNGTIIPARGHYLCVNSVGYSLASYPSGNGTTATGDATYVTDIPDNVGIALFTTNVPGEFGVGVRLDALGSTTEANVLYKEGAGYPVLVPFSVNYSLFRDECGKGGSTTMLGACPAPGTKKDTNDNAADFVFTDTNGTNAGFGQRLGAPGPQNLSSPIFHTPLITDVGIDPCVGDTARPNTDYNGFSNSPNSTFGQIEFRRTFTNNTGSPITRLRFRIIDLATFPVPPGVADMRSLTATINQPVLVDRAPCGSGTSFVTAFGTTLEQPPTQPNGGGFNSSLSAPMVTLGTPLAPGASVDLRFLFGLAQHGEYKLGIVSEALPDGGNAVFEIEGCTDGCTGEFEVVHTDPIDTNPTAEGAVVDYRLTFNQTATTGVDVTDFVVTTTGTLSGATVTNVVPEGVNGLNYIVTVDLGVGSGTARLDVIDNGTIFSGGVDPLGGAGPGNGDFTGGEPYIVANEVPFVVNVSRADANPVASPVMIDYTVVFSEAVTGVDLTDFTLTTTGTVNATITNVTGGPSVYNVTINVLSGAGTLRLDVLDDDTIIDSDGAPLLGPSTTGEVYTIVDASSFPPIPTASTWMLIALTIALAFLGVRRP